MNMTTIVNNLNKLLQTNDVNKSRAGSESGIGASGMKRILDGSTKEPSLQNIMRLAKYFGVTTSDIVGETKGGLDERNPAIAPSRAPLIDKSDVEFWLSGTLEPTAYSWTFGETSEQAFIMDLPEDILLLNDPLLTPNRRACFDPSENKSLESYRFALVSINENLVIRKIINDAGEIYYAGGLSSPVHSSSVRLLAPLMCLTEKELSF